MRSKEREPKYLSPSEQNPQVEQALKHYNCTLSERLSKQSRLYGLEHGKITCEVVDHTVEDFLRRKRGPEFTV